MPCTRVSSRAWCQCSTIAQSDYLSILHSRCNAQRTACSRITNDQMLKAVRSTSLQHQIYHSRSSREQLNQRPHSAEPCRAKTIRGPSKVLIGFFRLLFHMTHELCYKSILRVAEQARDSILMTDLMALDTIGRCEISARKQFELRHSPPRFGKKAANQVHFESEFHSNKRTKFCGQLGPKINPKSQTNRVFD
jgi:hypothetical protein